MQVPENDRMYTLKEVLAVANVEGRKSLRHETQLKITLDNGYMAAGEGDAVVCNISRRGICVEAFARLEPGDNFFFTLTLADGRVYGTVQFCWKQDLGGGRFRYGGRILVMDAEDSRKLRHSLREPATGVMVSEG